MPASDRLVSGYRRFRQDYFQKNQQLMLQLAREGQFPKIAIISCCDSRVEPSIILDCQPGDLFVVRNVANLVPPCEMDDNFHGTSAALEFAVNGLNVESIIILGHAQCGGIKALINEPLISQNRSFISTWMTQLEPVRQTIMNDQTLITPQQRYHACEQQGVIHSLQNLKTFPWITERVQQGQLMLHAWYYDLNTAGLYEYDETRQIFMEIG